MNEAVSLSILQFLLGPVCAILLIMAAVKFLEVDRRHHILLFFLGSVFLALSHLLQIYLFFPGFGLVSQGASSLSENVQLLRAQGLSGNLGMFLIAYGILIHAIIHARSTPAGMR